MQKVHFIGISGIGMSAVAVMLKESGWEVTGSDEACYPPASTYLTEAGIHFTKGYKKENIPKDVDLIVLGRNAKLSPETNEEVKAALASGAPVKSFAEVLGDIGKDKTSLVVVGSYGKSTCATLAAWILMHAGKDPSYFAGAVSPSLEKTARTGHSDWFIIEGDEYPTSQTDNRSKFLHYHAHHILFTSAVHDHINVFPTPEAYEAPFVTLLTQLPENGIVVAAQTPETQRVLEKAQQKAVTYSADSQTADWHAEHISYGVPTTFDLYKGKEKIASIESLLMGKHNVENVVGTAAFLIETAAATPEEVAAAVRVFKGVRRRLDNVAPNSSVPVYEGFGSSYEKARSAIEAMLTHFKDRRLVVAFEPHTFGWRNRSNLSWYDTVFKDVPLVFVAPPEEQGAGTHDQLSHEEIVNRIRESGIVAKPFGLDETGADGVVSMLHEDDVVLILTSGSMEGLVESIPDKVTRKFPKEKSE